MSRRCPECDVELDVRLDDGRATCQGCGREFQIRRKSTPPALPGERSAVTDSSGAGKADEESAEQEVRTAEEGWYLQVGVVPEGPLTTEEIGTKIASGELTEQHYVRFGSDLEWKEAGGVFALVGFFEQRAEQERQERQAEKATEQKSDERLPRIVNAREYIEKGFKVVRTLNVVSARCVYGSNIWKDWMTGIRDIVGGRSKSAEKLLRDTENELIRTLRLKAQKVGADALVEYRVQFGDMGGGKTTMFYGTAQATPVILESTSEADSRNGP